MIRRITVPMQASHHNALQSKVMSLRKTLLPLAKTICKCCVQTTILSVQAHNWSTRVLLVQRLESPN